jgi:dihydrofolate reductase
MSGGKVVVHRAMSLDGFIVGPEHEMDWIFEYTAPAEGTEEVMHATGAMLAGRRTYDVGQRPRPPETSAAYDGAWSGADFVPTH